MTTRADAPSRGMRATREDSSRGNALVSVLIILAALTPLGTFAVMQARLDVLVQHHVRLGVATFAVAESGLEHARAELRLDPDFDRLLTGPDRRPATSDDAQFPFLRAQQLAIEPGYRYDVRVERVSATMLDLISTASGPHLSTHVLALRVARDRALIPGAVSSTAARPAFDLGGNFRLIGKDQAGRDPAQPGLAVTDNAVAALLQAQLSPEAAGRIDGAGSAPSIAARAMLSVEDIAAGFTASRTADVGPVLSGDVGPGVAVSSGSLDIDAANGRGVLVVGGSLRVTRGLSFSGIVIVLGDVLFDSGSNVRIEGALLQGRSGGLLALLGAGEIVYDSSVIDQIDAQYPGSLPHRARVVGWRDPS